jgi:hypothetical protein
MNRTGSLLVLVVAVCAVAALGATGGGLFLPAAELSPGSFQAIRFAGAAVALAAFVALMRESRRLREAGDRGHDPTGAALASAATIMVVLALLAFVAAEFRSRSGGGEGGSSTAESGGRGGTTAPRFGLLPPGSGGGGAGRGSGRGGLRGGGDGEGRGQSGLGDGGEGGGGGSGGTLMQKAGNVLTLVILFIAAVYGLRMLTARSRPRRWTVARDPPVAVSDAREGLEASLGQVAYTGSDPRRQITAAYRLLLVALAAAGAPRERQEAPYEYLFRVLGPLGVRPEPMHRLTGLYVAAQFSEHPITERHREAAAQALEASLTDLRESVKVDAAGAVAAPELAGA